MRGDLTIRTTRTASGAVAVQVVLNEGKKRRIIQHMGSAHDENTREALLKLAQAYVETHCVQPSLFAPPAEDVLHLTQARLVSVTHRLARDALWACAERCGLHILPPLFVDLALMRIIEPASKLRTVDLLQSYFGVRYAERSVYRLLPKVLLHKEAIETAAIQTAQRDFKESLSLVLYDVTTLYFESFKSYDFQKPGFSKDNKPLQPQIVIGLITTSTGFPVMHDVFDGNAFEGHTMMDIVKRFQKKWARPSWWWLQTPRCSRRATCKRWVRKGIGISLARALQTPRAGYWIKLIDSYPASINQPSASKAFTLTLRWR
jgi:hypothetical protein